MTEIKTASDLRGFLADVLVGIRDGKITPEKAGAISKVSAQINQSLAMEVSAALQLRRMDQESLGGVNLSIDQENIGAITDRSAKWCEQCELRVSPEEAAECKSQFCKAKAHDA
jgi:hypothetical protein